MQEKRMQDSGDSASSCRPDEVLDVIGEIGRWQVRMSILLSLVGIPVGWHVISINFLAPPTDHWCAPPNDRWDAEVWRQVGIPREHRDGLEQLSQCAAYPADAAAARVTILSNSSTVPCSGWHYNTSEYRSSVTNEWDLVCDRLWMQLFCQGIYMTGVMVGVIFWGIIADRFGRRPSLLICLAMTLMIGIGTAAVNSIEVFLAMRFLEGLFGIGLYTCCFVLCMELIGARWRVLMGIVFCLPMSCGFMSLAAIGYAVRDWRHFQLAISLPAAFYACFYWLVPESPRWLLSRGRTTEAITIMNEICVSNGMPTVKELAVSQRGPKQDKIRTTGCLDIVANIHMLGITVCLFVCWGVNSLVYYGILLNTGDFGGDMYMNTFLMGVVELPAYAVCPFVIYLLGRRLPISGAMVGAGLSCLLTLSVQIGEYSYDWPVLCLALLGKFFITASFGIIYIYTAELYPTAVRSTGLATCSVGSRVGGIIAPFMVLLSPGIAVVLFGATAILSGLSILLLPETANKALPEAIADVIQSRSQARTLPKRTGERQPLQD